MTDELPIDQDEFQDSTEGTDPLAFPTLAFDADKYRQSLPEGEIPEAQAQDYLEALFHIMHTVIDMGMDLNPAHSLIGDACEKLALILKNQYNEWSALLLTKRASSKRNMRKKKNMNESDIQKALVYCRISSIKQRVEGSGLESQRHRCESYAQAKNYFVEQVFTDDVSGGGDFMKRPGMVALLNYLKQNRKTNYVVIFDDLKRFARHTMSHLSLRDELTSVGARVECLNYRFEDTPEARFVETIHAAQGQLEREQTGRQTVQKMHARLEQGYFVFHAPVGYRYEKTREHGKLLVRDEPVASIIAEALNGFASGRFQTPVEIRRFLESFPEFPKRPGGRVLQQKVSDMLVHPVYAGCVAHERWGIGFRRGHHQPVISIAPIRPIRSAFWGVRKYPPGRISIRIFR